MNGKAIIAGAVAGFVSALVVDLNAWSKHKSKNEDDKFSWNLAVKRWMAGGATGAATAAGWDVTIDF